MTSTLLQPPARQVRARHGSRQLDLRPGHAGVLRPDGRGGSRHAADLPAAVDQRARRADRERHHGRAAQRTAHAVATARLNHVLTTGTS